MSQEQTIDKVITGLKEGKIVMFIGLEALNKENKDFFSEFYAQLPEELQKASKYSPEEKLWSFQKASTQRQIFDKLKEYSVKLPKDYNKNLGKLLLMPFPLIISLLPDNYIETVMKDINPGVKFDRFLRDEKTDSILGTKEEPVVYNILGDVASRKYVMSYFDFFDFLSKYYSFDLPQKIKSVISDARYFLFYGFDMDKWYNILILYLIHQIHTDADKIAFRFRNTNELVFSLEKEKLNIAFIEDEHFIEQLFERAKAEDLTQINSLEAKIEEKQDYLEFLKDEAATITDPREKFKLRKEVKQAEEELENLKKSYTNLQNILK